MSRDYEIDVYEPKTKRLSVPARIHCVQNSLAVLRCGGPHFARECPEGGGGKFCNGNSVTFGRASLIFGVLFRVPGCPRVSGVEPWGSLRIPFGKIRVHLREDERGITNPTVRIRKS